ncbi:MAG: tRNA (adenosine(37)-N6)-threonylcarbamoyltransferase complex ATPase subunit type 1 TsaE [Candidatus Eisenbacteria bacterium]
MNGAGPPAIAGHWRVDSHGQRVSSSAIKRSASVEGTERLGGAFAPALQVGDVVTLSGPLGAGKTRFVSGLVHVLSPGSRVRSPSFTLVNEVPGRVPVYHMDLYRLDHTRDIESLGLEEYAELGALVVEWGERLPAAWLEEALRVTLTPAAVPAGDLTAPEPERMIRAEAVRGRGLELLAAWCELPEVW